MMRNTFGHLFTLSTFGESHGAGIGGVVDGMPAGIPVDLDFIQAELDRRRPGQSRITTGRQEGDRVEILSGVFDGKTTGCPIGFLVRNTNQHSGDYENVREVYRPSHADYTYTQKYGLRDHRGGDVPRHVKRFLVVWEVLWQNWHCVSWASVSLPILHRLVTSVLSVTIINTISQR